MDGEGDRAKVGVMLVVHGGRTTSSRGRGGRMVGMGAAAPGGRAGGRAIVV